MNRLLLLCCFALALAGCKRPAEQAAAPAPAPSPAPAATTTSKPPVEAAAEPALPGLHVKTIDGKEYDLGGHRGQWVVVNFWATWCGPCLKEMPELSALDAMREHVEVIGLAYEDISADDMKVFLKLHPVVYPIAVVDTFNPPADFATPRGLPMTYLIGPDGRIADKFLGPVTAKDIEAAIAKAGGPQSAPQS